MNPRARRDRLVVRALGDEVVVYDLDRHEAHCLNRSAALVFQGADGRATVEELGVRLQTELGVSHGERLAWLALDELDRSRLMEEVPPPPSTGHSRRALLRRAGLAAALLPVVSSILAPTAAEAAGTCVQGDGCAGKDFGTPCYVSNPADCGTVCACDGAGNCVGSQGSGIPGSCP